MMEEEGLKDEEVTNMGELPQWLKTSVFLL